MHHTLSSIENFIIDPPWPKRKGGRRSVRPKQNRVLDYDTMSVSDIFGLLDREIFPFAASTHNVFLWGIDQFLHDGEKAMMDRGYKMHARLIWDKTNGVAPAFTVRYSHEYLTWFYKPKLLPIDRSMRGKFTTVLREKSREHSRKPECSYEMVSALYPNSTKADIFSRQERSGWFVWGNQTDHFCAV